VDGIVVILILALGGLARYPCVRFAPFYNSDTAVLDLMARHLSRGEWRLYYWHETYYGALDPWLLRPLFLAFGQTPQVSQSLGFILSIIFLALFHHFVRRVSGPVVAHVSTLLIAIPPPIVMAIFFSVYAYPITGILGLLQWELALNWHEQPTRRKWPLMLGLAAGFSWYYFHVILFFWAAFAAALLFSEAGGEARARLAAWWEESKGTALLWDAIWLKHFQGPKALQVFLRVVNVLNLANFLLALRLWFPGELVYSWRSLSADKRFGPTLQISITAGLLVFMIVKAQTLLAGLRRLFRLPGMGLLAAGFAIGFFPALYGMATGRLPHSPGRYNAWPDMLINLKTLFGGILPAFFGRRETLWLALPRWIFILAGVFWLGKSLREALRSRHAGIAPLLFPFFALINVMMSLACVSLWDIHTARYLFPFFLSAAVGMGMVWQWLRRRQALTAWVLLIAALAGQFRAEARQGVRRDISRSYADLVQRLAEKGIRGGYADYWIAYRVTAETHEKVVMVPTGHDDRYPAYLAQVRILRTPVLLGQALPAWVKTITLKNTIYAIVDQENAGGQPIVYLRKVDSAIEL